MNRMMTIMELASALNLSKSSVQRAVIAGTLPQPIYLTSRAPRWPADTLQRIGALGKVS